MKPSILITGAASGIGRETALFFAQKGWLVGLFDLNLQGLLSLSEEIGKKNCFMASMDVTDVESIQRAVAQFLEITNGQLNVLFNCAGVLYMGRFEEVERSAHQKTVDVNLTGAINCIHATFEALKNTKQAKIITMSSASSLYGTPELSTYSATKFAVKGLTEALNLEFKVYDIHVCDVLVPYVDTPLLQTKRKAKSVGTLGINIQPLQVAELVWEATQKNKLHWSTGLKALLFVCSVTPFLKRTIVKHYSQIGL